MPIYHLFCVSPVVVPRYELPRVLYRDFMISAPSLQSAWQVIAGWEGMKEMSEIWGAERVGGEAFVVTAPNTLMSQEAGLSQHLHWCGMQRDGGRYELVHSGPIGVDGWGESHFSNNLHRSNPKLLPAMNSAHVSPDGAPALDEAQRAQRFAANDDVAMPADTSTCTSARTDP